MLQVKNELNFHCLFCVERWMVNSISALNQQINAQTDLQWYFQSSQKVKANDCIQIQIQNPYADSGSYISFDSIGSFNCQIDNHPSAECVVLTNSEFQITFKETASLNLVQGTSQAQIFRNPYSTRRISQVTVTHFDQCDKQAPALVEGKGKFQTTFQPAELLSSDIKLESSSQQIGDSDVVLTLTLTTTMDYRLEGGIKVKSPPWYLKEQTGQQGVTQDYYAESMIAYDTEVQIQTSQSGTNLELKKAVFDQSSLTLLVDYKSDKLITQGNTIKLTISRFQNPVDPTKVSGFQVSTTDVDGYLINQSSNQIGLSTKVNIPQVLRDVQIQMLGDENNEKVAQISTLQRMTFVFSMAAPLEPFCYFVLQFPKQLTLGQNVQQIRGNGIFKPYYNDELLNTGQYKVDSDANKIQIEGCRLADPLSTSPFGTLTISFIKLPNYVQEIEPVKVQVYSDISLQNLVIDDNNSANFNNQVMSPGEFSQVIFRPSNYYASAQKVAYTIYVSPEHGLTPDSRIVINMPKTIQFSQEKGCQVALTLCDCALDAQKNQLTLTNIFSENVPGGVLLKFLITEGVNPVGSRQAGAWSIKTETPINGVYYVVDGQQYQESFFAKAGLIFSELSVNNKQVSATETEYRFKLNFEHPIPKNGKLVVEFPIETELQTYAKVVGKANAKFEQNKITIQISEGFESGVDFDMTVTGVKNPRSFEPSTTFKISTTDQDDYIIDGGGQDINIECDKMADLTLVTAQNSNKVNGAQTEIIFKIQSQNSIIQGDVLTIELPPEVSFGKNVNCLSQSEQIKSISCSYSQHIIQLEFTEQEADLKEISFKVSGIINPPSTKTTSTFPLFYTVDSKGFKSQTLSNILTLQTENPAQIQTFKLSQGTEEYEQEGSLTLVFTTVNPIPENGILLLKWSDQIEVFANTKCSITTYKQILDPNVCQLDLSQREMKIKNAFMGLNSDFSGSVTIYLTRIKNPKTNENLKAYSLASFDGEYIIDTLEFYPYLKCEWPCQLCSFDKKYCTKCWEDKFKFMLQQSDQSTCLEVCPSGYSSNGSQPPLCQRCDVSCLTCADNGQEGDIEQCLTCAQDYPMKIKTTDNTYKCLHECPKGTYDNGSDFCLDCDPDCASCVDEPSKCTSCNPNSNLSVLLTTKCIGECPDHMIDLSGICQNCESPCASCDGGVQSCTSCDGTDGKVYRYGVTCVSECPEGTKLDQKEMKCTGCVLGCARCDLENPDLCFDCAGGYKSFEQKCYDSCPSGTIVDFNGSSCRSLSAMDAKMVYFPFLIVAILLFFVSWIGGKIKPKSLVVTNYVVMLSFLEFFCLLTQLVLSFLYGTYLLVYPTILIFIGYIVSNLVFMLVWTRRILPNDFKLQQYQMHSDNLVSSKIRNFLSWTMSWKFQKLLYGRFFGIKTNAFTFSNPKQVCGLMLKTQIVNSLFTWTLVILLNAWGVLQSSWGTQLYIMLVENILLAFLFVLMGFYEHRRMKRYFEISAKLQDKKRQINRKLHKRKLTLKKNMAGMKDYPSRFDFIFLQQKHEDLLFIFGGRQCKSDFYDNPQMEEDDRKVQSWPMSRKVEQNWEGIVADPPINLRGPQYNNCHNDPVPNKNQKKLKPHNGKGINKSTQIGGPFENDLLRKDAKLITTENLDTDTSETMLPTRKSHQKGGRGRKNQYFQQIDREDRAIKSGNKIQPENCESPRGSIESDRETENSRHRLLRNKKLHAIKESEDEEEKTKVVTKKKVAPKVVKQNVPQPPQKPDVQLRNFNELDCLGELNRDKQGNVIIEPTKEGDYLDLKQRKINKEGYLIDSQSNIISAQDPNFILFNRPEGDKLPAPFSFERFNFSAFDCYGSFKGFRNERDASTFYKEKGNTDLKNRKVNPQGYLLSSAGFIIDRNGRKLFDPKQLDSSGCLPKLFNYYGTQFAITDVMGTFKMDENSNIIKIEQKKNPGTYKDLSGHLVNEKGYLINSDGHIVNRKGKMLFSKLELKNGEFPKIFPFSKFDLTALKGTFLVTEQGKPILKEEENGQFIDDNGRRVNKQGYLLDNEGNVVDQNGNIMFEHHLLQQDGQLPSLFKNKRLFLGGESDDEISNLLDQIEGQLDKDIPKQGKLTSRKARSKVREEHVGSSYGSEMDISPSKFDAINQGRSLSQFQTHQNSKLAKVAGTQLNLNRRLRQEQSELSSNSGSALPSQQFKKRRKKKHGLKMVKVAQMFESDIKMAQAYGGEAQPRVRLVPKRFQSTQRNRGGTHQNDSFRESALSNSQQRLNVAPLFKDAPFDIKRTVGQLEKPGGSTLGGARNPSPSNQAYSIKNRMRVRNKDQTNYDPFLDDKDVSDLDQELAELYQQDVDQFIDGSQFEVQSLSGFSELSKGSYMDNVSRHQEEQSKTRQLENDYLRKLEEQKQKHLLQQQEHNQRKNAHEKKVGSD